MGPESGASCERETKGKEVKLKVNERAKKLRPDGRRMNALTKKTANGFILATSLEVA